MLLSVIMPVYNEKATLEKIVSRVLAVDLGDMRKELVLVDDGSTDGTRDILAQYADREGFRVVLHEKNGGKGRAVRTGLEYCTGDLIIIQDADLEYDPEDYPRVLAPILHDKADVVYGSRFKGEGRAFLATHYYGNKFITFVANILYNTCLTDIETCYKAFRREVFDKVRLRCNTFDIEPEITAKVFKNRFRVYEVPISYSGRNFEEGKKITWRDGFRALWTLVRFRFMD
ncbi:glycosyltransferase family 2 protein [Candidatus Sumerlaeota bacterium]|nr:glycosyltransferase family 2 protein [Candidatus Sumerlaeota bacterium]